MVIGQKARIEKFMIDMEVASKKNTEMMSIIVVSVGLAVKKKKRDIKTTAYAKTQETQHFNILAGQ